MRPDRLGFGIDCFYTHDTHQAIEPQLIYRFTPEQGFGLSLQQEQAEAPNFTGESILAIGEGKYASLEILKAAKQLSRLALAPYLGDKPLKSRELFIKS